MLNQIYTYIHTYSYSTLATVGSCDYVNTWDLLVSNNKNESIESTFDSQQLRRRRRRRRLHTIYAVAAESDAFDASKQLKHLTDFSQC